MSGEIPPGYEQFWGSSGHPADSKISTQGSNTRRRQSARTPTPELTDGQISVALDSDLLQLIDNITQELSRTTSAATSIPETFLQDTSRTTTAINLVDMLDFPPRASSLNDRYQAVQPGIPPRSSTGFNTRNAFVNSLGPTLEDMASVPIDFPPIAPLRPSKTDSYSGMQRLTSNRTESTGSRTMSAASEAEPLPQVLHALDEEPDECIVVVRRITRLGFKSNRIIKFRFEQIGWNIRNVVLLPSRSRPAEGSPGGSVPHARPSSMGFVVFSSAGQAKECLKMGSIEVEGVQVLVQPFTRQYKPTSAKDSP